MNLKLSDGVNGLLLEFLRHQENKKIREFFESVESMSVVLKFKE